MDRITEPELMLDVAQSAAYASADFAESDQRVVDRFEHLVGKGFSGSIVDLGCGPGNITFRLGQNFPDCQIVGIDGSKAMLDIARNRLERDETELKNLNFIQAVLPLDNGMETGFKGVVSNSLLHHLHNPQDLWGTIKQNTEPGAAVLIVDLRRPMCKEDAQQLVDTYASTAPEVLKTDFYNSLLAAFEPEEVIQQLNKSRMNYLHVQPIADRYLEVSGNMPG